MSWFSAREREPAHAMLNIALWRGVAPPPFDPPEAHSAAEFAGGALAPRPSCRRVLMAERRTVTASGRARRLAGRGHWRSLHQNSVRRAISALTLASPRSATPCNERAAASDS